MDNLAEVDIDPEGVFKYIQIEVKDKEDPAKKRLLVRGYKDCDYHADILERFTIKEVVSQGLSSIISYSPPGGGRIEHLPDEKKLKIYGYSMGFG